MGRGSGPGGAGLQAHSGTSSWLGNPFPQCMCIVHLLCARYCAICFGDNGGQIRSCSSLVGEAGTLD